jgi:hypothetical protein
MRCPVCLKENPCPRHPAATQRRFLLSIEDDPADFDENDGGRDVALIFAGGIVAALLLLAVVS